MSGSPGAPAARRVLAVAIGRRRARARDGGAGDGAGSSVAYGGTAADRRDRAGSFGGSNQLAQQARQGFPFDVFLSASPLYTQALFAEGIVRKPVAFATNSLVLIVPRRNPARIASVDDLARRPKLRLVVAAEGARSASTRARC